MSEGGVHARKGRERRKRRCWVLEEKREEEGGGEQGASRAALCWEGLQGPGWRVRSWDHRLSQEMG